MGNEVREVENTKDASKSVKEDNQISFLSVFSDAGKAVISGASAAASAAKEIYFNDALATGAKVAMTAAENAVVGTAAASAAVEIGKTVGKATTDAVKSLTCNKEITDVAKEAAIGAVIGGAVGACAGDSTRALALASIGGITAGARRVIEDCCKPKAMTATDALKQVGQDTWNHVKNRPLEAAAEGVLLGPAGIVAGAMVHKMMDKTGTAQGFQDKLNNRTELMKEFFKSPFIPVVSPIGTLPMEAVKEAAKQAGTGGHPIDLNAAKESITKTAQEIGAVLEQHRKDHPTAAKIEKAAAYATGGVIGGAVLGPAYELGHVGYEKARDYIKSWMK